MTKRVLVRALLIVGLLVAVSGGQALAGGPVCPPPACPPPVCAPPMMCPPPMAVCGPAPACGPPPVCGPRPVCGPPPCQPPQCKENPLAQILRGACDVVVGVVALPFRAVDCLVDLARRPKCGPPPCGPMAMCPPPMCPPPMCGPPVCGPPGVGYGMGVGRPMGFGYGGPRTKKKFAPFAKKDSVAVKLIAGSSGGVFGTYW
jgi:hypothetical protein